MDNVYRFLVEHYEITGNYEDRISKRDFDVAYTNWALKDNSVKAVEPKNLASRMEALGIHSDYGNIGERHHIAVYRGIRKDSKPPWDE